MHPNHRQAKCRYVGPVESPHPEQRAQKASSFSALLVLIGILCGCESVQDDGAMANSYYLSPNKDLRRLGRVALVELDSNMSAYSQFAPEMTDALFLAVQKEQLFGLTAVRRDDKEWQSLRQDLTSVEALRQLAATREALRCNALLTGTVTQYRPYPHLAVGLRLQLLDLTDGQLVWAIEQVWDSADKSVQRRVKTYAKAQVRSGAEPIREELVVVSTLNFVKFVAYEVARTLERERAK